MGTRSTCSRLFKSRFPRALSSNLMAE
jgi:hypothetical protein